MRIVTTRLSAEPLELDEAQLIAFGAWLFPEIEDAVSARYPQDVRWREALRQYDAVPLKPVRNIPIENAPNIEVPVGATLTESVYAQVLDLIFNIQPVVTVRPVGAEDHPERKAMATALQQHVNWGAANEWNLRAAAEEAILDDVKLGTGVLYTPFVESIRKGRNQKVVQRGPRIMVVPVEDFFVPGGAYGDLQETRWAAVRKYYTEGELVDEATANEWDIKDCQPLGAVGWVRTRREMLGRTWRSNLITSELYEVWRIHCYFDIDNDGIDEDLLVVANRSNQKILKIEYNLYDKRPFNAMRFQLRGHLFYGIGVMDMTGQYQQEASDVHSYALTNALLANCRLYKTTDASVGETQHVWPSKVVTLNDIDAFQEMRMSDIYPSMLMMQGFPIQLAQTRVGLNDVSQPNRSAMPRTPGITAISLLNQANKRFTPAFDGVRLCVAGAVTQCLYREQERLLAGDKELEDHIVKIHGPQRGQFVIQALKDRDFDLAYAVELTASSSTINRDVERQNSLLLVNILGQYYQRVLELVAIASNPQTPEPVRDAARKVASAAGEIVQRTLATFDQVRDPSDFIVDVNEELDKAAQPNQQGMAMLQQLLGGLGGGGNGAQPGGVTVG